MADQGELYTVGEWQSEDGLTLRYRDYAPQTEPSQQGPGQLGLEKSASEKPVLICLAGLTRNARDYAPVAERLCAQWRVICPDLRGRGLSDYAKDPASYVPDQYARDILRLIESLGLERVVMVGTALGGLVTLQLGTLAPDKIVAAVLNDIGPEITPTGLARIRDYVGLGRSFPTWMHAARALKESTRFVHPDYDLSEWLELAKQTMRIGSSNRIVFDYDVQIAEPFKQLPLNGAAAEPLWQALERLSDKPLLIVRGALSDILSADTLARMVERVPNARSVTVARTGHAPRLNEPDAVAALDEWLASLG